MFAVRLCAFVVKLSIWTVGVPDARRAATGDVAQSTGCTFSVEDICYYLISFCDLSRVYMFVTCFFMQCTSALQECSFVFLSLVRVDDLFFFSLLVFIVKT